MNKRQISSTSYQGGGMVNKIIGIAKTHPHSNDTETYAYPTSEKVPSKFLNELGITLKNEDDFVLVLEIQFDTKKIILQGYYANYNGSEETENYDDVYSYRINQLSTEFEKWLVSSLLKKIKRIKDSIRLNKIDKLIKELEKKSGKTKKECQEIIEKFKQIEGTKFAKGGGVDIDTLMEERSLTQKCGNMYFNEDTIEHFKQEAQIYDKTTVIELVERFVHVDITLEDGETEEMYIKQLLKEIYG
jgi:virulence-associated protein VapD